MLVRPFWFSMGLSGLSRPKAVQAGLARVELQASLQVALGCGCWRMRVQSGT